MNRTKGRKGRCHGLLAWAAAVVTLAGLVGVVAARPAMAGRVSRTGTMSVAAGAVYTTTASVTVSSSVSQASSMRLMNAGGTWSAWRPYAASTTWTLVAGDGTKTVQAQYRLTAGKTVSLSDGITLDTTAPATTTDYDGMAAPQVTVRFTATDPLSGVATTSYRVDGGPWCHDASAVLCLHRKRNGYRSGPHTLEYFSADLAGNVESVRSVVVTLGL